MGERLTWLLEAGLLPVAAGQVELDRIVLGGCSTGGQDGIILPRGLAGSSVDVTLPVPVPVPVSVSVPVLVLVLEVLRFSVSPSDAAAAFFSRVTARNELGTRLRSRACRVPKVVQ